MLSQRRFVFDVLGVLDQRARDWRGLVGHCAKEVSHFGRSDKVLSGEKSAFQVIQEEQAKEVSIYFSCSLRSRSSSALIFSSRRSFSFWIDSNSFLNALTLIV